MQKTSATLATRTLAFSICLSFVLGVAVRADDGMSPPPALVINEVMASNVAFLADAQGDFDDWIEIYNDGEAPVDLAGMYLTDDMTEPTQWRFPDDASSATTVAAKGYLIVWADGDVGDSGLHASFRLGAGGDEAHLFDADAETLLDSLVFGEQTADLSFGRYPDGADTVRFFAEPTPGGPNSEGYLGEVAPLQFSRERGFCDASFELTITTATEDAQILYTVDGRVPDDGDYRFPPGRTYTGPIPIGSTTCVRAMAVKPGWKSTKVYTNTYVFDVRPEIRSLPIISLVGDAAKTFYEPDGVMAIVGGTYSGGVWTASGPGSYNNVLKHGLERPVSCEWIEPDTAEAFQIDCGLRVHGSNWMRPRYRRQNGYWSGDAKFSLRLYFRGQYGANWLEHPLFPLSNVEQFATIVLRSGHNDRVNPFIKDELLRRLHRDMGQTACMGTFANLFINGQYKGYFNPTEHVKEEACQLWFDSDMPWDVMTMNGIRDGDTRSWNEMTQYARSYNLSSPAYYAELSRKLDVVSFIDYLIIRLWPNDWDWPQNNWSAAAERSETGQWKFFVWDAEGTFVSSQLQADRFGELNSQGNPNGILYRALKSSSSFRLLFADRLYKHFYNGGALTEGNIRHHFFEMRDVLRGVIPSMNTYIIDGWAPSRRDIFLNACAREGMYTFDGPSFVVNGAPQHGGHVATDALLQIVPSRAGATIYYSLDGTDPAQSLVQPASTVTTLISSDASKRVLVPTGATSRDWQGARPFDDSAWTAVSGPPGGVGYERNSGYEAYITAELGKQMYGVNGSCYIRIPFSFSADRTKLDVMTLRVQYDDGFVAYLNGVEVARRNFTGTPVWNSRATASHSDTEAVLFESIDLSAHLSRLQRGNNVLAIQGLNASLGSSDFLIAAELTVSRNVPIEPPDDTPVYTDPIRLTTSTQVKARLHSGSAWSALAEATFAVGPVAESLRISEIMYHPADPNAEYVELVNIGSETIDLNLVRFTDGIDLTFPAVRLDPGARCLVVQDIEAFNAAYGENTACVGQYTGSLNNGGERIELQDAAGRSVHAFRFEDDWYDVTDGAGFSLTLRDPGAADPSAANAADAWRPSAEVGGSPGYQDDGDLLDIGAVVINELLANATGGVSDWIELYNTTDQAIEIGGWLLSDDPDDVARYEIAAGTVLGPHAYLVLTADENFDSPGDPGAHTPFALSRTGETIYLYSASDRAPTGYRHEVKFGASEPGVTFGRYPLSTGAFDFAAMSEPTPGAANAETRVGPIVISEIMYHPDSPADAEYVELLNISGVEVTLYDAARGAPWRFADGPNDPGVELLFPEDPPVSLAPGQYLLLVKDQVLFEGRYNAPTSVELFEWSTGKLSNAGETIQLSRPGAVDEDAVFPWIVVDCVTFSDGTHPESFPGGVDPWPLEPDGMGSSLTRVDPARIGNEPENWQAAAPSPGATKRRPGR